jgi:hypothetical protein
VVFKLSRGVLSRDVWAMFNQLFVFRSLGLIAEPLDVF